MFDHPPGCRLPLEPGVAAQYIWDPGADSDLREHGLRFAREGTAKGQEAGRRRCGTKACRIAPHVWKSREPYESFHTMV